MNVSASQCRTVLKWADWSQALKWSNLISNILHAFACVHQGMIMSSLWHCFLKIAHKFTSEKSIYIHGNLIPRPFFSLNAKHFCLGMRLYMCSLGIISCFCYLLNLLTSICFCSVFKLADIWSYTCAQTLGGRFDMLMTTSHFA